MKNYVFIMLMIASLNSNAQLLKQSFILKSRKYIETFYENKPLYKMKLRQQSGKINATWYSSYSIDFGYFFDHKTNLCIGYVIIMPSTPNEFDYLNTNFKLDGKYWIEENPLKKPGDNTVYYTMWETDYKYVDGTKYTELKAKPSIKL